MPESSPPEKIVKPSTSKIACLLGPMIAGVCETLVFHPYDTLSKRLQNSHVKIPLSYQNIHAIQRVIFPNVYSAKWHYKVHSSYKGLSAAFIYRINQRLFMYGGQPIVKSLVDKGFGSSIEKVVGSRYKTICTEAIGGGIASFFEVILLPLDSLKVVRQTELVKTKSYCRLLIEENKNLYRGSAIATVRNIPYSLLLFGGTAWMKQSVFKVNEPKAATFKQELISASFGAFLSIFVTNPADVIKTRIQVQGFSTPIKTMAKTIYREEGLLAFMKGIYPKIISVPRIAFSMTLSSIFTRQIDAYMKKPPSPPRPLSPQSEEWGIKTPLP